jgi:hypothetical protein
MCLLTHLTLVHETVIILRVTLGFFVHLLISIVISMIGHWLLKICDTSPQSDYCAELSEEGSVDPR